jgi:hypothetical protein
VHGFARTAMPWARKVAGLTQLCIFLSISVSSASPAAAEAFQAGAGCSGHRSLLACFAAARPAGHIPLSFSAGRRAIHEPMLYSLGRRMVQPAERADRNFLALFAKPDGEDDGKMWIDRLFDPLGMYRCVPSVEYQRAVKLTPRRVG